MRLPENQNLDPLHLLAIRLNLCGQRAIFEFLADMQRGKPFAETVKQFSTIDPVNYIALTTLVMKGNTRGR